MKNKLTIKQERFILNILSGMTESNAYIQAGYSKRQKISTIYENACRLTKNSKIVARLTELNAKAESDKIMLVKERRERLSEIARARLTDYQESGQDGGWISIGKESPNTAALSEITSTTKYDDNGANPTLITRVKLHNPIQAIDILNKMDRIYSEGTTVNIDNRKVEAQIVHIDAAEIARAIIEAYRLGLTPAILGGDGHSEDASLLSSPTNIQATPIP